MPQLGAHVSAAGGPQRAPERGAQIGCDCIQVFTRNQRTWRAKPVGDDEAAAFRRARAEHGIGAVMSHASYLINLGTADAEKHAKSQAALEAELERCHRLGIELLNFHPGAHVGAGMEAGIEAIAATLNAVCRNHPDKDDVLLVLENVAGQGTTVGADFGELAAIIERLEAPERFGVCIDTAHAFAAGYELHTEPGWQAMWAAFDAVLAPSRLVALHLNDSRPGCGSRKDRHALLGRGAIGPEAFVRAVTDPRTRALPQFLETPAGPAGWAEEIRWLRACAEQGQAPALPQIEDAGVQL
ncbi:deoxyribonuclease IV [Halorhodospira neutriphila]|uniref:Probable endonuclease 4 n=1 Tax=Halorhodospira neutriphila TaxID=168379 RepID=A0ABS1E4A1_9GAMM|nr:deoxyribonuclease IV [Halorhodospira neutriphila]MBK1726571.1 deoxyribonuclease IV [Halorhodospira neutriphila]